jgi:hypothetical protein
VAVTEVIHIKNAPNGAFFCQLAEASALCLMPKSILRSMRKAPGSRNKRIMMAFFGVGLQSAFQRSTRRVSPLNDTEGI